MNRPEKVNRLAQIPAELRERDQWVVNRQGRPFRGDAPSSMAKANDPQTWTDFETAMSALAGGRFDAVAFVFDSSDPFVGIDIDACRNPETGVLAEWAAEVIDLLDSYTEVSPSGTGIRIIIRAKWSEQKGSRVFKLKDVESFGSKEPELLVCGFGRALSITGDCRRKQNVIRKRDAELQQLLSLYFPTATKPVTRAGATAVSIDDRLLDALLQNCEDSDDRSGQDFKLCLTAIEQGWSRDEVWERVREHSKFAEREEDYFEQTWDAAEQASRTGLSNATRTAERLIGRPIGDILRQMNALTDGWPRRAGLTLFVHEGPQVSYLDSATSLFGWIHDRIGYEWNICASCVTKEEFFKQLQRTARQYEAVHDLPHVPPLEGYYYACDPLPDSDGSALARLVAFFNPATEADRELIIAAFATPLWGGQPGSRPLLVISSEGRGHGKSSLVDCIARLYGGCLSVRPSEDWTAIAPRLLSQEGRRQRIVVLDNLKSRKFSSQDLESMITADRISGKQLYRGEGSRTNDLSWFITVNAPSLSTDMAHRAVNIHLGRPKFDQHWKENLHRFVASHRTEILADLASLLRRIPIAIKSSTRWGAWELGVLAKLQNPQELLELIVERRDEVNADVQFGAAIEAGITEVIRNRGLDPDCRLVRFPMAVLVTEFQKHGHDDKGRIAIGLEVSQLIAEGQLPHISRYRSKKQGTQYVWRGERAPADAVAIELPPVVGGGGGGLLPSKESQKKKVLKRRREERESGS